LVFKVVWLLAKPRTRLRIRCVGPDELRPLGINSTKGLLFFVFAPKGSFKIREFGQRDKDFYHQ